MKQAVLTFEKKRVLLAELPEGAYGVCQTHIYHGEDPITFHIEGTVEEMKELFGGCFGKDCWKESQTKTNQ